MGRAHTRMYATVTTYEVYMSHLQIWGGEKGSIYGKGYIAMAIQEWGKGRERVM